jgi:hypothetical protein
VPLKISYVFHVAIHIVIEYHLCLAYTNFLLLAHSMFPSLLITSSMQLSNRVRLLMYSETGPYVQNSHQPYVPQISAHLEDYHPNFLHLRLIVFKINDLYLSLTFLASKLLQIHIPKIVVSICISSPTTLSY